MAKKIDDLIPTAERLDRILPVLRQSLRVPSCYHCGEFLFGRHICRKNSAVAKKGIRKHGRKI